MKDEEYLLAQIKKMETTVLRGGDKKGKPEYVSRVMHGLAAVIISNLSTSVLFVGHPVQDQAISSGRKETHSLR